jgi:hypothetical protein
MPLIVYLDSQDFSHIAEPPPGKIDFFKDIEAELIRLIETGAVEIRYSAAHVSEISYTSLRGAKFSGARAFTLKTLCRGKCMRMPQRIMENEISSHFDPTTPIRATSENDEWIEFDFSEVKNFLDMFKSSLQDEMRQRGANRKARRAANTIDLASHIKTSEGQALLTSIAEELNAKFPMDREIDRSAIANYMLGKRGANSFISYLKSIVVDPVTLITKLATELGYEQKIPALIRDVGRDFVAAANPVLQQVERAYADVPLLRSPAWDPLTDSQISRVQAQTRRKMVRKVADDLGYRDLSDAEVDGIRSPSVDVYLGAVFKRASDNVSAAKAGKPMSLFKISDGADLFHATCIPYVDFFRADKAWAGALVNSARTYKTALVGRIEDLLPTIRQGLR